jgi:tetratricopeptide (TPR) repeat protein
MKKALILAVLGLLGIAAIGSYANIHLYYRSTALTEDPAARIRLLEKANTFFPWSALVHFELGKAYFDRGIEDIGNVDRRDADLRSSFASFERSLRLDPGALQTHFQFAQSLLYMAYLSLPAPVSYFEEYKKAALLTGHNSQIFYEVGKVLLSRWTGLSPSERVFTRDILKRMLAQKDKEKLAGVLQVWDMNSRDYALMDAILPEDAAVLRIYSGFLGEKGLSLEARHAALARAEHLEFTAAERESEAGQRALDSFRTAEAIEDFSACLKILGNIKFYQSLAGEKLIAPEEYAGLLRSTYLNLAKCRIEETRSLDSAEPDLEAYLSMEDRTSAVGELETFLKERNILPAEPALNAKDLKALVFQLRLSFRQNRYRDITRFGASLEQGLVFVPEAMRADLLETFEIIGDAFQKLDYIYEAERFYDKALDGRPGSFALLLKIRKGYERLNDDDGLRKVDEAIRAVLSPGEQVFSGAAVPKGTERAFPLVLEAGRIALDLSFAAPGEEPGPVASLEFNGRVVWEDRIGPAGCTVNAESVTGANRLVLGAVSAEIIPVRLAWRPLQ